jgi:hypothetical protein
MLLLLLFAFKFQQLANAMEANMKEHSKESIIHKEDAATDEDLDYGNRVRLIFLIICWWCCNPLVNKVSM